MIDPSISPTTYRQMTTPKGAIKNKENYKLFMDECLEQFKKINKDLNKQKSIIDSW